METENGQLKDEGIQDKDAQGNSDYLWLVVLCMVLLQLMTEAEILHMRKTPRLLTDKLIGLQRAWGDISEEFVLDGSYISLREVMLSYSFKPSILKKTPFAGITLSALGRNLMYLEEHMQDMGISPESAPNTSAGYAGYRSDFNAYHTHLGIQC